MADTSAAKIMMYGTNWCSDCARARYWLDQYGVDYEEIDVDFDDAGLQLVRQINNGRRIVPTIVFPDGSILVEPSNTELIARLDPEGRSAAEKMRW